MDPSVGYVSHEGTKKLISNARKNQLTSWRRRLVQHLSNPSLVLKRIASPRQSVRLLMAPFVDQKLLTIKVDDENKMLANAFKSFVLVKNDFLEPIVMKDFESVFRIESTQLEATGLGDLFDRFGSDKRGHNYDVFYEKILNDLLQRTNSNVQIFEIGLGTNNLDVLSNMGVHGKPGASLRAFREYSRRIQTVGADIDKRVLFQEERIKTFYVDQLDFQSLIDLIHIAQDSQLIIDDGLHNPEANLNVLLAYKDSLQNGSWIVIEDIAKNSFNLRLWQTTQHLMTEFETAVIDFSNVYVFIARKAGRNESF